MAQLTTSTITAALAAALGLEGVDTKEASERLGKAAEAASSDDRTIMVGDTIRIICMSGESAYAGRTGVVKYIGEDCTGEPFMSGTWGGLCVYPRIDRIEVIAHGGKRSKPEAACDKKPGLIDLPIRAHSMSGIESGDKPSNGQELLCHSIDESSETWFMARWFERGTKVRCGYSGDFIEALKKGDAEGMKEKTQLIQKSGFYEKDYESDGTVSYHLLKNEPIDVWVELPVAARGE